MTSRLTHWLTRFFIIMVIGLLIPAQVSRAQGNDYPIVDTGQVACYDSNGAEITCPAEGAAFYGQDAQYTGNAPSYTNNGDGTISDNVTGLMWQRSANTDGDGDIDAADKLTYAQAQTYCADLSLATHSDWQLPDIKQLYSLIDFRGTDPSGYEGTDTSGFIPFIDTDYFDFGYGDTDAGERIIDAQYASSTLYVGNSGGSMFGVNLADGRIKGYGIGPSGEGKTFFVLCVRDNVSYGANDFADNGDSTITDSATGLMWTQNDSATGLNWEEALAWVETKNAANYLGHDDWRLPNAKELQGIVDYDRSPDTTASAAIDPLFNATGITNEAGVADYPSYWSSTTHANWTTHPGGFGAYVAFGRAMGYMDGAWTDVHGAGAQRSDPKSGDPDDWPTGHGPQGDAIRIYNYVRLVRDADSGPVIPPGDFIVYLPLVVDRGSSSTSAPAFGIEKTLSDGAQRHTIAFDALAFLTGDLGSDSFFPPGKVADFWGFQYLRDNDPTEMGHNTDFLTRASLNMLTTLTSAQRAELIALAEGQVDDINQYAMDRFVLIQAFRRLLADDLPSGSTGLDEEAIKAYSADLYQLDGEISYERAQVMGVMISAFTADQRAYLDAMVGQGMLTWPEVDEPAELQGLEHDVKVAVMTYAGDMFSWYAGSVEADVYFCPERQGTYFGSFYMKDAPAVGNPDYTIPSNLTSDLGAAFLDTLTSVQTPTITGLVNEQKPALYEIVDRREDVATLLRQFMSGGTPDQATVIALMREYGELDGEIIYRYATAFAEVNQTLTTEQQTALMTLRTDLLDELSFPDGAYLYADPIAIPDIPNTDFLFAVP